MEEISKQRKRTYITIFIISGLYHITILDLFITINSPLISIPIFILIILLQLLHIIILVFYFVLIIDSGTKYFLILTVFDVSWSFFDLIIVAILSANLNNYQPILQFTVVAYMLQILASVIIPCFFCFF